MSDLLETVAAAVAYSGQAPSADAWFAGGDRVGYDPKAHTIFAREDVAREDAPLRVFLRQEGDPAHAVSFLPGFPDGSFGWAKVRHPPRSGWLDELGRLKDGRSLGLGVARCAPYWVVQNCPAAPSAVSCSRMYVRTCSSSKPTVDTA
jgi:hypothetical protein